MTEIKLSDFESIPQGKNQYLLEFIHHKKAIKISESESEITIGLTDINNFALQSELKAFHSVPVKFLKISEEDLAEYLSKHFSVEPGTTSGQYDDEKILIDKLANDAPIINLVNNILLEGIRIKASDIHLEHLGAELSIRYRVDGILQKNRIISSEHAAGISSRVKIMANLNIAERRLPQDGRLTAHLGSSSVEFRVSVVPLHKGESIVLRLFQKQNQITNLEYLGFSEANLKNLRQLQKFPNGLILVTGPTGSGKTTTLSAMLKEMVSDKVKIIAVEDPVETFIPGVNQIQTNETIGLTFDSILRRILRQDPDIIMVGEIRDRRTAELAVRSALTGHLVFSSLHTNDALSSIPRLLNMGMEPYLLAGVLRGLTAQRLVRKICPDCKTEKKCTGLEKAFLESHGQKLTTLFSGTGCKSCNNTGYQGRTLISEVFLCDDRTEELTIHEKKHRDFVNHYKTLDAPFLIHDGINKIADGITTIEEVERAVLRK